MEKRLKRLGSLLAALLVFLVSAHQQVRAQGVGTVKGTVTDPSASVIPNATVQITGNGTSRSVKSDGAGVFTTTLPPGTYAVRADAKGFVRFEQPALAVAAGQVTPLDIALQIASDATEVSVTDSAAGQVSVDPSQNVGALVLKSEDLDQLPDDPDDLQADLQALAGPAAGPNGAQFFVDGFSGGQLPPKSSIREIRINSNPFSSEFDRPGFGRIEILTKPGTDNFHGSAFINYGDRVLDTRNPFLADVPGYSTKMFQGNVGGPINKKSSFFLDFNRRQIDEDALIKAQTLDSNFNQIPYIGAFATPNRLWSLNGRIDYQINATNTLVMRYTHSDSSSVGGVGNLALPSQETISHNKNNTAQITETMVIGTKAVDETRFQFRDMHTGTSATGEPDPGINVSGAFNSGGPPQTQPNYTFDKAYEIQNILTFTQGTHAIKVGGRARQEDITDFSTTNFNGSYTFSTAMSNAPCLQGYPTNSVGQFTALDVYQETQIELARGVPIATILANGCGPTQFTLSQGIPLIKVRQFDVGAFVQDDWRFRPNLTISLGVRYESQNNIKDHNDFAPRVALAWAPGSKKGGTSKTVVRGGFGIFYDRFAIANTESTLRNNGFTQQSYQINAGSPALNYYPFLPPASALGGATLLAQNIDTVSANMRAPYLMQSNVTVERALPARTSLSVGLTDTRGLHTLRTRDINAPFPNSYIAPTPGVVGSGFAGNFPFPGVGPIYQFESSGIYKQLQAITSVNTRFNRRFSLNGYYALGFAHSNANGLPMDQYNDNADYGRTNNDARHTGFVGGTINLWWGINAAPFVTMRSGTPFNITTGSAFNGDGILNARPFYANSNSMQGKNIIHTQWGTFDTSTSLVDGVVIPYNLGEGPAQFSANLRLSKTWGFGEKTGAGGPPDPGAGGPPGGGGPRPPAGGFGGRGGGGPRGGGGGGGGRGGGGASGKKYSLTATVNSRNFINHVNLGTPTGQVSSPFFGQSTALAGGGGGGSAAGVRRIEFQLRLSF